MDGELTNLTGEVLLVHGPKRTGEAFDNSLYALPPGQKTPEGWDCDRFFAPNGRISDQALSSRAGPVAVKYRDYRSPIIEMPSPGKHRCPLNEGIYVSGELNWCIPNLGYSDIKSGFPEVPNQEIFIRIDSCQEEMSEE